jgi:hypothetical protein
MDLPPPCPRHGTSGRRCRDGTYGTADHRRQRYRCRPTGGEDHVYTPRLPRFVAHDSECDACERRLARDDGPQTARTFSFATRDVAAALIEVGRGRSYRAAAERVRRAARRGRRDDPFSGVSREGNVVADWVEVFAPVVAVPFTPRAWPSVIVLDELTFDGAGHGRDVLFHVLGVLGQRDGRPEVLALRAGPSRSAAARERVLRMSPGRPERVVCDEAKGALAALGRVWSDRPPEVWLSHFHLRRGLEALVGRDVAHLPLRAALVGAFDPPGAWDAFVGLARRADFPALDRWLARVGHRVAHQIASGHEPRSTGALEQRLRLVKQMLYDRRTNFRNRERLDRLLLLMRNELNGHAAPARYARLIRAHITPRAGYADPRRLILDRGGRASLWTG